MARHSHVDKRARRTIPRQCVSDYGPGVHKDAPVRFTRPPLCNGCGVYHVEVVDELCPGCEAYKEHQV